MNVTGRGVLQIKNAFFFGGRPNRQVSGVRIAVTPQTRPTRTREAIHANLGITSLRRVLYGCEYVDLFTNSPVPARPRNLSDSTTTRPRESTVTGIPMTCIPSNIE